MAERPELDEPRQLLRKLDGLLVENPGLPSYSEDMNDEEYTLRHIQWHKRVRI